VTNGYEPACVKTCPTGALKYGDRSAILSEAKSRVAELGNGHLYGETELGGLHVIYVLDDKPEVYGLPVDPKVSPAVTAWQDVLKPVGWGIAGLTVLGLAFNYIIAKRKIKIESEGK
jgi:ferredoxin